MKTVLLPVCILILCLIDAHAQTFQWAKQVENGKIPNSITMDVYGNAYLTSRSYSDGKSLGDFFISKLNSKGDLIWTKQFIGAVTSVNTNDKSIAVDASGNVYTTGFFKNTVDFDPGNGTYNLTSDGNIVRKPRMNWSSRNVEYVSNADIFISKLDSAGNFVWAKRFGTIEVDISHSIALAPSGNIYVSCTHVDTVDTVNKDTLDWGYYDGYRSVTDIDVIKLGPAGNFIWKKRNSGVENHSSIVTVDAAENVYLSGTVRKYFEKAGDLDPGKDIFNFKVTGDGAAFISKLDKEGVFLWAKQFGMGVQSMSTDPFGNIYLAGFFGDTLDFDPGINTYTLIPSLYPYIQPYTYDTIYLINSDLHITKLDGDGNFNWAKHFPVHVKDGEDVRCSIATDVSGNIYTIGNYQGQVDFVPGNKTFRLISKGLNDVYIHKIDTKGNMIWAKTLGGYYVKASSIAVDLSGNIYTTGKFVGTDDFDPGSNIFNLISQSEERIFIQKMSAR